MTTTRLILFVAAASVAAATSCDVSGVAEEQKALVERVCALESEMRVVERVMQELLQRIDATVDTEALEAAPEKRKNEFIRFGKRSAGIDGEMEKRKNEFIRFGKRKNEFIRFGRSLPLESEMSKRKNEFIRFG